MAIYTQARTHTHSSTHAHARTNADTRTRAYTHTHLNAHLNAHLNTHLNTHTDIQARTHNHTPKHVHTPKRARTHTNTQTRTLTAKHADTHPHPSLYTHTHVHTHAPACTHACTRMYTRTHLHVHKHADTHTPPRTHTCTHMHTCTHTHTHPSTCAQINLATSNYRSNCPNYEKSKEESKEWHLLTAEATSVLQRLLDADVNKRAITTPGSKRSSWVDEQRSFVTPLMSEASNPIVLNPKSRKCAKKTSPPNGVEKQIRLLLYVPHPLRLISFAPTKPRYFFYIF